MQAVTNHRVLLVDPDTRAVDKLASTLTELGWEVLGPVADGATALVRAAAEPPALALVSHALPGSPDGPTTAGRLCARGIPVVYLLNAGDPSPAPSPGAPAPCGWLRKDCDHHGLQGVVAGGVALGGAPVPAAAAGPDAAADSPLTAASLPEGFLMIADDGRILESNSAYSRLVGETARSLAGRALKALDLDAEALEARLSQARQTGEARFETRHRRRDGAPVAVAVCLRAVRIGPETRFIAFVRDISERRHMEDIVRDLAARVSPATGEAFLDRLTAFLGRRLGMAAAFVGRLAAPGQVRMLSLWVDGAPGAPTTYPLPGSACERILSREARWLEAGAAERFTGDALVQELGIDSCAGAPVVGAGGETLGVVAVMDRRPLRAPGAVAALLELCSGRVAAELDRLHADTALRESEQRFRVLAETTRTGILVYRDNILYANPAAQRISGYSLEALRRMPLADVVHPDMRGRAEAFIRARMHGDTAVRDIDLKILTAGGEARWVHVNAGLIDYQGAPAGVASVFDITERHQAETAQRRRSEGLERLDRWARRLIQAGRDTAALHGHIAAGARELTGADTAVTAIMENGTPRFPGAVGEHAAMLTDDPELLRGICARTASNGENLHLEADDASTPETTRLLHRLGARAALAVPLDRADATPGCIVVFNGGPAFDAVAEELLTLLAQRAAVALENLRLLQTLEERVEERTAELAAINRELESFSYSVSHDLRAPLRSINGFSAALMEDYADRLDEPGRHYLERVREASTRMGQLIDDLLDLSRVSRGELEHRRVDLARLARQALEELEKEDSGRRVEARIQAHLPASGDPRLLRIMLHNLLGNAWKFTRHRDPAVIEVGRADNDGAFYVRDNGAGFDMAYSDRLFGAFQRLHPPAEFEGSGIGLATVQRIVHRHGGRVWAQAQVDKGATFWFSLPSGP